MDYHFDEWIPRKGTGCTKWDNLSMRISNPNALPMWVADCDFICPEPVVRAVQARAEHPIYGYAFVPGEFGQVTAQWMQRRHGFSMDPQWALFSPGVVPALAMAVLTFTQPGDEVILQTPVYHPFANIVRGSGRVVSGNPLVEKDLHYTIDFEDLERRAASPKAKLMLLCNPHNPVGRVWTEEELKRIAEICAKHQVLLVSDEIHADIVFDGHRHVVAGQASPETIQNMIICHAPSKTFNLAGLEASAVIVPNSELRAKLKATFDYTHINVPNDFAMAAYLAAYSQCDDYLQQLLPYLWGNILTVEQGLRQRMPRIRMARPEGTYLLWLDARGLGMTDEEVIHFFMEDCAIGVNPGSLFGREGEGFVRLNIASPRVMILRALDQMEQAYRKCGF